MKRLLTTGLALLLVLMMIPAAFAAQPSEEFMFELSVDGSDTKQVEPGDIITVMFTLVRTDSDDAYQMYGMQNQIRYDSNFFELVEGSAMLADGIQTTDLGMRDESREFYMNFLSLTGGQQWNSRTIVGSFQLKVIGTGGTTKITNENYLVSTEDGTGSYQAECRDVTVSISSDCTVTFESNGGSPVAEMTVPCGERLEKPADPTREGYVFEGWYRDFDLKEAWNFKEDSVEGNMTLYAKWSDESVGGPGQMGFVWLLVLIVILGTAVVVWILLKKRQKK